MRNGKGCQSCRSRHVKCVTETGSSVCTRCKEGDRTCVFDSRFQFRQVHHVDTTSQGVRSRTHLDYEDDQLWVPTREAVGFVLEDGAGAEYGTADFIEKDDRLDDAEPSFPSTTRVQSATVQSSQPAADDPSPIEEPALALEHDQVMLQRQSEPSPAVPFQQPSDHQSESGSRFSEAARPQTRASGAAEDYTSPASLSTLSRRHEGGHRLTWGTGEYGFLLGDSMQTSPAVNASATPADKVAIELSHREALLMQHFVQKLAPWIDCCDCKCRFAQEVPRRAVRIPMVLYAVLAVSSLHLSLMSSYEELEASYYHGKCLELVIDALSQPEASYDDNLFATIVCMHIYGELNEDDFLHLQGVGRLLNAIPTFANSGGLAEAASWQALRQDIYMAVSQKLPPSFDLDNYCRSRVFDLQDDDACANVIILLFARILRLLYGPPNTGHQETWDDIEHSMTIWDTQRSRIFQPLFAKEADPSQDQPFPIIRLINPAQVVSLQYFNACRVLVRQHKPPDLSLSGFEAVRATRNRERDLLASLGTIIGLAGSNTWVENANFTAHHLLKSSGYHISNPVQRKHSIEFLRRMQSVMGFKTLSTIALLQGQWQDLDGSAE